MPLPTLPIPLYPDVPNLPGVPPLLRNTIGFLPPSLVGQIALTGDLLSALGVLPARQWGVFRADGTAAINADSFISIDFSHEYRISNYPQEQGGFESYNKVQTPFEPRITLVKGGNDGDRTQFLNQIALTLGTTDLYSIITPEKTYSSVNVTRYDYQRTRDNGATLITANIWFEEVRVTGTAIFTNTISPNGTANVNTGPVQPVALGSIDPVAIAAQSVM